jgi:hypothetical protein
MIHYKKSNSQAHQESFVLNVLNEKKNGYYVELGAGWPVKNSNTYLLETKYGWKGVSFENGKKRVKKYNQKRKNKTLLQDAITFDYLKYFYDNNFPKQIDYLQMDIHPAEDTLLALKNIPLDRYRFSVITYEHNGYQNKQNQIDSQRILKQYGYKLVVEGLMLNDGVWYEDWWVDPLAVDYESYKEFIAEYITHHELFNGANIK